MGKNYTPSILVVFLYNKNDIVMKKILLSLLLLIISSNISAQVFSSVVKDSAGVPIYLANVAVLNKADSSLVTGTVTDSLGQFVLNIERPENKFIVVSFIGFKNYVSDVSNLNKTIVLQNDETYLQTVEVNAERQLVRLEKTKFIFDAEIIRQKKVVISAFDLIKELPSVEGDENNLTLIGGQQPRILINYKKTKMDNSMLIDRLKTLTAKKVKDVEISFDGLVEYGVQGAVINVILFREKNYSYSGQIGGFYRNQTVNSTGINGSVFFSSPKWEFDASYSGGYYINKNLIKNTIKHNVQGSIYNIYSESDNIGRVKYYNIYTGATYNISDNSYLNLSYVGQFTPYGKNKYNYINTYTGDSKKTSLYDKNVHDISLSYKKGNFLDAGVEYLRFESNNDDEMIYGEHNNILSNRLNQNVSQKDSRLSGFINLKHNLPYDWDLSYGVTYSYTNTQTDYIIKEFDTYAKKEYPADEHSASVYFNIGKGFLNNKLYTNLSLSEDYKKSTYENTYFLPSLSFSFSPSHNHILRLIFYKGLTSYSFWDMQDYEIYMNKYEVSQGNPNLTNSKNKGMMLYYILKQKYTFNISYQSKTNYAESQRYLRPDTLIMVTKTLNFDSYDILHFNAQIPIDFSKRISTRLSATMNFDRFSIDDWFGKSISKKQLSGYVSASTYITLSMRPRIILSCNLRYNSPSYHVLTKYDDRYMMSLSLNGGFFDNRLVAVISVGDIFESFTPKVYFDRFGQYYETESNFYKRSVQIQLSYKFKGYKNRRQKSIDTSRFGT